MEKEGKKGKGEEVVVSGRREVVFPSVFSSGTQKKKRRGGGREGGGGGGEGTAQGDKESDVVGCDAFVSEREEERKKGRLVAGWLKGSLFLLMSRSGRKKKGSKATGDSRLGDTYCLLFCRCVPRRAGGEGRRSVGPLRASFFVRPCRSSG